MNRIAILGLAALTAVGIVLLPNHAMAQSAKDFVGTWELVSNVNTAKDGTKTDGFGAHPKGIIVFGEDGSLELIFTNSDIPKFASDNRTQGTPDENKAVVVGVIAYYGTYTVENGVMTHHIVAGTWPSWNGTDQKRPITSFTKDEVSWTLASSLGGSSTTTLHRVK